MINDGLWCAFEQCHMGNAGEVVAEHYHVGRDAQDDYAARSHQKAARATEAGAFATRSCRSRFRRRKGDPIVVDRDEAIRADTTVEALARAEAGVQEGRHGHRRQRARRQRRRVGAGRDGGRARARSLGLTPLARIVGAGDERPGAEVRADDAGRSGAPGRGEGRLEARRRRSLRAERSVLGAGGRRAQRARDRSGQGERQRRRRRARPRDRLERRAGADDAALRAEAPQPEARHRDALPRRRQRRRARRRARCDSRVKTRTHENRRLLRACSVAFVPS